jgi:hypothetical protein
MARWRIVPDRESRTAAVAIASAGMFVAAFVWRFLTFTGFSNDHYAHLALAQQMLLGERPIRDFSDPGWPLTYLISAGAWQLAGSTMAVEWFVVTLGFALGAAFTVVAAHQLSGSLLVALLLATLELIVFPRTYSYPKMLVYGGAGWAMLVLAADPARGRVVLMAAIIALAFLLRHDHGAYIGVAAAICVALASRPWRLAARQVGLLTVATSVFLAPWVLYVALNGGLPSYFDRALEYARLEANATTLKDWPQLNLVPGQPLLGLARPNRPLAQVLWKADIGEARRRSLEQRYNLEYVRQGDDHAQVYYVHDASADNIRALADDPAVAGSVGLGRVERPLWREVLAYLSPLRLAPALHSLQNAQTWLFWLFWTLPVVALILAGWHGIRGRERWPGELAAIAGLSAMTLLVNSGFLRDPLSARLADAIVPPALVGAWLVGLTWTKRVRFRGLLTAGRTLSFVVLFVTATAVAAIAELPERIDYTGIRDGVHGVRNRAAAVGRLLASPHRQTIAPPSRVSAALMHFFEYIDRCTSPSDQLIVTGDYSDVLILAGRGFASDGVVFGVWYSSVAHQAETVAHLEAKPALFSLLIGEDELRQRYPNVLDYLARDYAPMADIVTEGDAPVRILLHRRRVATGVDGETGWPCFM